MKARSAAQLALAATLAAGAARAQSAPPPSATVPPTAPSSTPQDVSAHDAPRRPDVGSMTVNAAQASKMAGTEGDPIKIIENLPGLARPSFGSGQLVVWGSSPTENRTYVDGVEIPALFHGNALRSTINGALVRDVTLTPGAYGAEYGRAIGGMVRVETRDLPDTGVHGYAAADTLDGSAMVTAALNDRVRIAVAGRYGWLDSVLKTVDARNVDQYFAVPRYGDYQAKMQVRLRDRESLDAVFLGSTDQLTYTIPDSDPARARSETTSAAYQRAYLHYRRTLDDGAVIDVVPWVGHDTNNLGASFGANPATLNESTLRWGLRASHQTLFDAPVALKFGVDVDGSSAHIFRNGSLEIPPREGDITVFGQAPGDGSSTDTWNAGVVDVAPYIAADMRLGPITVSPSLRADAYLMNVSRQLPTEGAAPPLGLSHLQGELEPRISTRIRVTDRLSVLAAAGVYSQGPNPADLSSVFGNPTLGPETADHATVGESLRVTSTLSAEVVGFYKWMSNLAVRDPAPTPKIAEALLQEGVGRAYGVQLLLRQRPWHGFFGWVAYTISRSERRDTPTASWRLFDYDQPHVLTVVASKELGKWSAGVRFRFAEGLPRTPVIGSFYDTRDDVYQPVFGAQNTIRLPAFWQLDLRVDRMFQVGDSARVLVYLEALNVTNCSNGEEYIYNVDYSRRSVVTGLPAIAVLGARVDL